MKTTNPGRTGLLLRRAVWLVVILHLSHSVSVAGPEGAEVVSGVVQFGGTGNYTSIHASDQAIINYQTFDIGLPETVEFIQPSSTASVLNRILSASPTTIDGTLLANGRVFFVNPAGVIFGESAQVNVTQLVASALNISNVDFINGNYVFSGGAGSVVNKGNIEAERAYLIGRQVANFGNIDCPGGYAVLAAGERVFLGVPGSSLLVEVDASPPPEALEAAVEGAAVANEGTISAGGGKIILAAAGDVYSQAISNVGTLSASVDSGDAGDVEIAASDGIVANDGVIEADSGSGLGGRVAVDGFEVTNSGTISATGAQAGAVDVHAEARLGQFGTVRADGTATDGGRIDLWAGETVALGAESRTTANAGIEGEGGEVIVFSPDTALFRQGASIEARGGAVAGDGGFVEVSGRKYIEAFGQVNAGAINGAPGTFLLDPTDVTLSNVINNMDDGPAWSPQTPDQDTGTIDVAVIAGSLANGTNVSVDTFDDDTGNGTGTIVVSSAITVDLTTLGGNTAETPTLTLNAQDDIDINAGIGVSVTDATGDLLNLVLNAQNGVDIGAGITDLSGGTLTTMGTSFTNAGGTINTGGGDVNIQNTGAVTIGADIDAGAGNVTIDGGAGTATSIDDGGGTIITSGTVTLEASGAIGALGAPIATTAGSMQATSTAGGDIVVQETSGLTVAGTGVQTQGGNGNISLDVDAGDLIINSDVTATGAGNVTLNADAGAITMADGAALDAGSGKIDLDADQDITLGGLATTDADSGASPAVTITTTSGAVLDAGDTHVDVVAPSGTLQVDAVTGIGSTNAIETTVARLDASSTAAGNIAIAETDAIILTDVDTVDGAITVTAGGALTALDVQAGDGAVDLSAGGTLTATLVVAGDTGDDEEHDVTLTTTAAGDATLTSVTADDDITATTAAAGGDIVLGALSAGDETALTATAGAITDGSAGETANIDSASAVLVASTGIGTAAEDIDVTVANLEAQTATGGIYVTDLAGGLTLGGADATLTGVQITGAGTDISVVAASPLTVDEDVVAPGAVTLEASGNAGSAGDDLTLNANVTSTGGGTITLRAGDDILQTSGAVASNGGPIEATADTENDASDGDTAGFTQSAGTSFASSGGKIDVSAYGNVSIALLDAGTGNIEVDTTTGAIADNTLAETANLVTTNTATLNAVTGIGAAGDADLDTTIGTLIATNSTSGDIVVQETDGLIVTGTGVQTQGGNGNIDLDVDAGNLIINSPVTAHGAGTVTLNADGGTVDLNTEVSSSTGALQVSGDAVTQDHDLTTGGGGTVTVTADNGDITMADGTTTTTNTGLISYSASGNVALSLLTSTSGPIEVTADNNSDADNLGAISDNTAAENANLVTANTATLNAATGIGSTDALETQVGSINVDNSTSGDVRIDELAAGGALEIFGVNQSGAGAVVIQTLDGTLTVTAGQSGVSATSGEITLTAQDAAVSGDDDLVVNAEVGSSSGKINLDASNDVIFGPAGDVTSISGEIEVVATDAISMADGALLNAGSGKIDLDADGNITLGGLATSDADSGAIPAVTITTTSGAVLDGGDTHVDVVAPSGTLQVDAVTGIGTGADDLDTSIGALIATNSTSGDIVVQETSGLIVTGTGVQTQGGNGNIDLDVDAGNLTIDSPVSAHGAGTVTLNADAGTVDLNAQVSSTTGALQVNGDAVTQDHDLSTGDGGTVTVTADNGDITMADGTTTTTTTGLISYSASGNVALSLLTSTSGPIEVTADNNSDADNLGAISDNTAAENANLITTNTATLNAATGIGAAGDDDLDTSIDTLIATNSTSGDIVVQETSGLIVGGTGVQTQGGNGNIDLDVDAGNLTIDSPVSAHGAGNVTLNADAGTVDLNAEVSSSTGALQVSGDAVTQDHDLTTGGGGTVTVTADNGDITMADGTTTTTNTGLISYSASGNVALSLLTSTSGPIEVTADNNSDADNLGAITDNTAAENANLVTANTATLNAATGIGSTDALETQVGSIDVDNSTSGDVRIDELAAGGALEIFGVNQSGAGAVVIQTLDGTLTVTAGQSGVSATSGEITLTAQDAAVSGDDDLVVNAAVGSSSGKINLDASNDVIFGPAGDVTSISGEIEVAATDAISMADGAALDAGSGKIDLGADQDITLGGLATTDADSGASPAVTITTTSGAVLDAGDTHVDVVAPSGTLQVDAVTGIGSTNAIETTVARLDASSTAAGNIAIAETDEIILADVDTVDGEITVTAGGALTALDVQTGDGAVDLSAGGTLIATLVVAGDTGDDEEHDVTLTTTAAGDATLTSVTADDDITATTAAAGGDIVLGALSAGDATRLTATAGAITDGSAGETANIDSASAVLVASTGIGTAAEDIDVTVANLEAQTATGGIYVTDLAGGLTLGGADATLTGVQITGAGTDISVVAASPLTVDEDVVAPGAVTLEASGNAGSAGDDLTLNANVTSTGGGTITLRAGDGILQTSGAVASNGGPIEATADTENDASDGDTAGFTQSGGTSFASSGGEIDVSAHGNVSIALLDAGAGNVEVDATAGAINDATDDTATDITGDVVTLTAHDEIGGNVTASQTTDTLGALETSAAALQAMSNDAGDIVIVEADAVELRNVQAESGSIYLEATNDGMTQAPGTAIRTGGTATTTETLTMIQSDALDLSGFTFENQGNTALVLESTAASVTVDDSVLANAADQWQSIEARAQNGITLLGDGSITTNALTSSGEAGSTDDDIVVRSTNGHLIVQGDISATHGGVALVSENGGIYSTAAGDPLAHSIKGYSDHAVGIGVDLDQYGLSPENPGLAAIVIISYESLHLGSAAELVAKGFYHLDLEGEYQDPANEILPEHDDREPTMLEFEGARAGDRIDIAIYLASRDQDAQAGHNVTLNAGTVSIEPTRPEGIGTLVVDAYDTVSFDDAFKSYLSSNSNLHRIEVVSRISDTLDDAQNYTPTYPLDDKLPYAYNADSIFDVWTKPAESPEATELNKVYLLRGPKVSASGSVLVRAEELARAEVAPLPPVGSPPLEEEEEIPVPKRDAAAEIEAKYPGLLRLPVPNGPALASDVVLRKIAEHIKALDAVLQEHQNRAIAVLGERAGEWLDVTWDAEGIARFEEQLAADPALATWMSSAFDFVRTAKVRCGHSDDDSIGFFSQHLTLASDDAFDVVDAYLREKLASMHSM